MAGEGPKLARELNIWEAIGISVALMAPSMAANINPQGMVGAVGPRHPVDVRARDRRGPARRLHVRPPHAALQPLRLGVRLRRRDPRAARRRRRRLVPARHVHLLRRGHVDGGVPVRPGVPRRDRPLEEPAGRARPRPRAARPARRLLADDLADPPRHALPAPRRGHHRRAHPARRAHHPRQARRRQRTVGAGPDPLARSPWRVAPERRRSSSGSSSASSRSPASRPRPRSARRPGTRAGTSRGPSSARRSSAASTSSS